jgi:hypothetical protein
MTFCRIERSVANPDRGMNTQATAGTKADREAAAEFP